MRYKYILIIMTLILSGNLFVLSDVMPPNSHFLSKCVTINNLNEFPEIYLMGYITGPMVENKEIYLIKSNECLDGGYKFNTLQILAAKKEYIDSINLETLQVITSEVPCTSESLPGEICYQNKVNDINVLLSENEISPFGSYISNSNSAIENKIEYSIIGFKDNKLILYKSKETFEYENGTTPTSIETFEKPSIQNISLDLENQLTQAIDPNNPSIPIPNFNITNSSEKPKIQPNTSIKILEPKSKGLWNTFLCLFKKVFGSSC